MPRPFAPLARLATVSTLIAASAFAAPVASAAATHARAAAPLASAARPANGIALLTGIGYDAAHQALVIPFAGPVPQYELHTLTATHAYFDLAPAHYAGLLTLHAPGGGPFVHVTMANRPEGTATRLAFQLTHPGQPELVWDKAHHRLLIALVNAKSTVATPAPTAAPTAKPTPKASAKPGPTPKPSPKPTAKPSAKPSTKPIAPLVSHAATSFRSAYFDNARGLLVLPFTGAVPTYGLKQPQPGDLAIDFAGAALARSGSIRQELEHHPLLRRWSVQELPGTRPTTRMLLTMSSSAEVGVAHDPSLGAMLVIPEPLAASSPPPTPAPANRTRLATPVFDPRSSELTLTFAGPLPAYNVLRPAASTAYVDLPYAELIAGSMPFERVDLNPLVTFWLLAGRPVIDGQRLILHLPFGGELKFTPVPAERKLVIKVVPPEAGLPSTPGSSSEPTPEPTRTPTGDMVTPAPEISLQPTPTPLPSTMLPAGTPGPFAPDASPEAMPESLASPG